MDSYCKAIEASIVLQLKFFQLMAFLDKPLITITGVLGNRDTVLPALYWKVVVFG